MARWSGYATQSKAWQAGYDWAYDDLAKLDAFEAPEALGYAIDTPEGEQWQKGAEFGQAERYGSNY